MATRRSVMKAFGKYLDHVEWFSRIKRGEAEYPPGYDASYFARYAQQLQSDYERKMDEYLGVE